MAVFHSHCSAPCDMVFTALWKCLLTLLHFLGNCLNLKNAELCYFLAACSAEPSFLEDTCAMHTIIWIFLIYVCMYLFPLERLVCLFIIFLLKHPFIRALPDDFDTAPLILVVLLTYGSLQLSLVLINLTKGKSYVKLVKKLSIQLV